MRPITVGWLLMLGLLMTSCPLLAQTPPQPQAPPQPAETAAPEQDPGRILQKMCDFLKSPAHSLLTRPKLPTTECITAGKKLQYGH